MRDTASRSSAPVGGCPLLFTSQLRPCCRQLWGSSLACFKALSFRLGVHSEGATPLALKQLMLASVWLFRGRLSAFPVGGFTGLSAAGPSHVDWRLPTPEVVCSGSPGFSTTFRRP